MGERINPELGSKLEGLNNIKRRFSANLIQGFMKKYSFKPIKYLQYSMASNLPSKGDIVDAEHHKLKNYYDIISNLTNSSKNR